MKYYSCFIYVVCVIISFCFKTRVVFPYILYLFTFGVFMMSRIFLDAFEVENAFFDVATWANDWSFFSLPIKYEMLNAIVFYLLFSFLGFLTSNLFIGKSGFDMDIKENSLMLQIRKIGFFLFIVFCLPYLAYLYQAVLYVADNGYLSVYLNESETTVSNPFLRICDDLCVAGIYLYLSTFPIGKKYVFVVGFYFVTLLIMLGTGGRGATFSQILMFLSYIVIRGIKINVKRVLVIGIIGGGLIYIAQFVSNYRNDGFNSVKEKNEIQFTQLLYSFFWQQGTSIQTIGRTIQHENEVSNGWLYFIGPITNSFRENVVMKKIGLGIPNGQTLETVKTGYSWADNLSYRVSPKFYLTGHGMGSSTIAECYVLGYMFGIMIVGYIYIYMMMLFISKCKNRYSYMYLLFYMLPAFFISPRSSPLTVVTNLYRPLIVLFCIQLVYFFKMKFCCNRFKVVLRDEK